MLWHLTTNFKQNEARKIVQNYDQKSSPAFYSAYQENLA